MLSYNRTLIHVEVKASREHRYYGSMAAMFEDPAIREMLGIKYQTFRTKGLSESNPFENEHLIIRKGVLGTIDHS